MFGGGGSKTSEASNRLGLPLDLIEEAEAFRYSGEEIYPDNVTTVGVFVDIKTQWRTGPGGVIGLDYNVLPFVLQTRQVEPDDQREVFEGVKTMEAAALRAMRERND